MASPPPVRLLRCQPVFCGDRHLKHLFFAKQRSTDQANHPKIPNVRTSRIATRTMSCLSYHRENEDFTDKHQGAAKTGTTKHRVGSYPPHLCTDQPHSRALVNPFGKFHEEITASAVPNPSQPKMNKEDQKRSIYQRPLGKAACRAPSPRLHRAIGRSRNACDSHPNH